MNDSRISIITPVFNAQEDIETCILSVANQSYKNIEHIIIDGFSTDNTLEAVKRYANKYSHIFWISEKDEGIYDAMNKGIDKSNGEWIYFLGSDDVFFDRDAIERVFIRKDIEESDILYGNVKFKHSGIIYDGKFNFFKLMEKNICHQGIFFRKDVFNEVG